MHRSQSTYRTLAPVAFEGGVDEALDVGMPRGKDGFLTRHVLTGHPGTFVHQRAAECGATAFLEKPIEDVVILSLVRRRPPCAR